MYSSIQSVFTKVKDSIGSYLFSSSKKNNNALIQHDEQYQTSSPQCNELQPELTLDEDVNPEQPKSICNTPSFYLNKKEQYLYPNDYGFNKHNRKLNINELNEIQHSNCSSSEHETHSIIANANKFTSTINNNSDRKLLGNKNVLRDNTVDDVDSGDGGNNKRKIVNNDSKTVKENESVNESDKDNTFVKLFEQRKKILEEFKKQQNDKKNIIINYYTPSHNPRFNHLSLEYSKQIYIPSKQKESKVESKNNNNNNNKPVVAVTVVSSREKETKKEEKTNNNSSSSSKVTFCAPQNQPKYKSIFTTETSDSKVTFGFSSEKKVEEPKKEKEKSITNDSSNNNNNKPLFGFVNSEQKEYKSIFDNNTNSKSTVTFGFKEDKKNNDTHHINTKEEQTVPPKETKSNNLFESQKTTTTTKSLFDSPIKTTEPKPTVAGVAAVSTKNNSLFTNPPEPKSTFDSSTTTTSLFSNTTTTQTKSLFEQSPNPKSLFTFGKSLFDNSESSSTKETTTSFSKPSLFSSTTTTTTSQPLNLFSTSTSSSTPTTSLFTSSTSLFTSSKPTTTDTQPQQGLFSNIPKSTLFTSSSDNKKFEFSFGKK